MKYYIIAGEASGDLHGSNLIKEIKKRDSSAELRCWGGDLMQNQGVTLVKHFKDLAFMGFVEVLLNLKTILSNLKFCKKDIEDFAPDVLVLIDYPGFNLRIAAYAHQKGIRVVYYISPQIWAWKQSRVHQIKKHVDDMLCILPFEKDFYAKYDFPVHFVGHPLIDAISGRKIVEPHDRKQALGLSQKPIIALLPGSRKQEINTMLPIMLKAAANFKEYQIVIAGAPSQSEEMYTQHTSAYKEVSIVYNKTYDLLEVTEAALVTSGTATLETALFKVPEVVCYKGSFISYWIARQLIKVKYISLVNLIADREMVKEMIQSDMEAQKLENELKKCLQPITRDKMIKDFEELTQLLGGEGASAKAAEIIVNKA